MIHDQKVITGAGFQRRFPQGHAPAGGRAELRVILNHPAARDDLRVNLPAGELFRGVRHGVG